MPSIWDDLTEDQKSELVKDYRAFLETEMAVRKRWLEKQLAERWDDVINFVFLNGRLPQINEL
jgi:hypothetical protein